MDQNQITNNQNIDNDLQKAIDSITNSANIDPVFSDPVAAPSSIPEGDTGVLDEPVGPFPEPEVPATPAIENPAPSTMEPAATEQTPSIADSVIPNVAPIEPITPNVAPVEPNFNTPSVSMPSAPQPINPVPPITMHQNESPAHNFNTTEIKKAALHDLIPILDKININDTQKFKIYRDIFEEFRDYTILEPAYQAAHGIPNEAERAEALLYLVELIDQI